MTQDTMSESDKNTGKHHIQEGREVSPFPAGDHNAARNRQDGMTRNTNNKKDPQKSIALKRSTRKLLEDLNMFDGTNLTLISDVDQDREMFSSHKRSLTYRCIISLYK